MISLKNKIGKSTEQNGGCLQLGHMGDEDILFKGYKPLVLGWINSRHLWYSRVTVIHGTVLHTLKLLWE